MGSGADREQASGHACTVIILIALGAVLGCTLSFAFLFLAMTAELIDIKEGGAPLDPWVTPIFLFCLGGPVAALLIWYARTTRRVERGEEELIE